MASRNPAWRETHAITAPGLPVAMTGETCAPTFFLIKWPWKVSMPLARARLNH